MLTRKRIVGVLMMALVCWMGTLQAVEWLLDDGLSASPEAWAGPEGPSSVREYKPGEIIVKFKKGVADSIEEQLRIGKGVRGLKLSAALDKLKHKYKVKNIEAVAKNFRANRRRIENLKKKGNSRLTKKEKHLLRRLKRAPKKAKVPDLGRIYRIELGAEESALDAVAEFSRQPDVEYAELNHILWICTTPSDPNYSEQWGVNNTGQSYPVIGGGVKSGTSGCDVNAPEAWDISSGSSDVWVAVIDTGVDWKHGELINNIWVNTEEKSGDGNGDGRPGVANVDDDGDGLIDEDSNDLEPNDPNWCNDLVNDDDENGCNDDIFGWDIVDNDNDPMDPLGHGTHCAGIIAAEGNNGVGIAGLSWDAKIMALKISNSVWLDVVDAIKAVYYATDNGADITSNSWGGPGSSSLRDAFDYAHSQGVVNVAAAGNYNSSSPIYPAGYDGVISVAATDSNDEKAWFSNYGDWIDVAAPGLDILSLRARDTDMYMLSNRPNYAHGDAFYPHGDDNATMYICSGTSMACPHVAGACALLLSVDATLGPNDVNDILVETVDTLDDPNICKSGRINVHRAVLEAISPTGHVRLDRSYYSCDSNVGIFLADSHLADRNSEDVTVETSGGDSETVSLAETGLGVGVFTGVISTEDGDANTEDGVLQVSDGETISVTYSDSNDGSGNPAAPNDIATVDCVEPNGPSGIEVDPVGPEPEVSYHTDEVLRTSVRYGTACGGSYAEVFSLGTDHAVALKGVSPYTDYYFEIKVSDAAGNTTIDSNDSNCYTFTTDGPNDIYVPSEYSSVQDAINYSWDGGTVWVSAGTYGESIDFKGKAITVSGTDVGDWDVIEATIIEPNYVPYGVAFQWAEDSDSILTGLTIKGGEWDRIYCARQSSPSITRCIVEGTGQSHGIYVYGYYGACSPRITYNHLRFNYTGVMLKEVDNSTLILENNWIHDNHRGILVYRGDAEGVRIKNNCIYDNNDGIEVMSHSTGTIGVRIVNNTIVDNNSGVYVNKRYEHHCAEASVRNCILWGNQDDLVDCNATYSCVEDVNDANGVGNITDDPCFVYADANDFHIRSNSPCIDAGDPNGSYDGEVDIDGEPRVMRGRVDMGSDEVRVTWYVDGTNGSDDNDGLSWENAFATIQKGIDSSKDDDVVDVNEDTYYETIDFGGKAITVRSVDPNDWEVVASTIIDANGGSYGVLFDANEDFNSVIEGFTITNSGGFNSGGIKCNGSSPIMRRCITEDNSNGICCLNASPIIANNKIRENAWDGIYCSGSCAPIIRSNWICDNLYGILLVGATSGATVRNNTIVGNSSTGIYLYSGAEPNVANCILWDNGDDLYGCSATYSCIEDCNDASGTGNICIDPCFVDADVNDFHLDIRSPCINRGDPNGDYDVESDIDGEQRVIKGRVDIGADEKPFCVHNIDKDKGYLSIQAAIDDASSDDEIVVDAGIYYENIDFNGMAITLRSTDADDWEVVASTIIDANNGSYGVLFDANEDSNSVIEGFTVTNQGGWSSGAIKCDQSSPTVRKCIISDSSHGIYCANAAATISNNKIRGNVYDAVCSSGSSPPTIKNNWLYDNGDWGILLASAASAATIRNNTIVGNPTAGIYVSSGTAPDVSNCILWDNGDDLYGCTATYSCIEDCNDATGTGNICGDANDPNFVDPNDDDFHLSADSPCVDSGDPNGTYTGEVDIDFEDRVMGDDVDMGGDEYDAG